MESGTQQASYSNSTIQYGQQTCLHLGIDKLVQALVLAQADFAPLTKGTENPYFKSLYADLPTVIKATLPALNKHGLTVIQLTSTDFTNKSAVVTTILVHTSGQQISSTLSVPTGAKFDAQSLGAAWTYAKRYAYQAIVGVAADIDDDGNSIATGFEDAPAKPKYEPKPGKPKPSWTANSGFPVKSGNLKDYVTEKSPESGQVPKATIPPAPKPLTVNTNAGFASQADHEPTKEEKDEFKKKARLYVQEILPQLGVENPAETLKKFVENLTGVSDTKKLSYNQWTEVLLALDKASSEGKLKEVVEG